MTYSNVEKSAFRRGEYVGYAAGVWRIRRCGGGWIATHREGQHAAIRERTLASVSRRLAKVG